MTQNEAIMIMSEANIAEKRARAQLHDWLQEAGLVKDVSPCRVTFYPASKFSPARCSAWCGNARLSQGKALIVSWTGTYDPENSKASVTSYSGNVVYTSVKANSIIEAIRTLPSIPRAFLQTKLATKSLQED